MAELKVEGLEEYAIRIDKLQKDAELVTRRAVYAGAKVVADSIKEGIRTLPTDTGYGTEEDRLSGVSAKQKGDLINGFGLAPIKQEGDYTNTKAGFDGYGTIKTKKYPKGVPNAMLMRSVESGTSFRKKNPVIRRAVNASRKKAQQAMEKEIDKAIEKEMR